MADAARPARLRGLTFTRQLPNPADPVRGTFVVEQMRATSGDVDWLAIAPVAWPLRRRPVPKSGEIAGIPAEWPRYPVLPRRLLYSGVAGSMARGARAAFGRALTAHKPAFVHAHELYPSGAAAAALARRSGLPLIVTVHGSDLYSNLERPAWARAVRAVLAQATAIICVSSSLAEDTIELGGADPARVVVVPDVFDDVRFSAVGRTPHDGPPRILSVGRLVPVKGFDVLLRALGRLSRAGTEFELTLVGSGPLESDLRVLAVSEGLAEKITFAGSLSPESLADQAARSDLYVQPSRKEGFGLALVEAMATGLPAVATDSGGPADILTQYSGVLVTPDDVDALATGLTFAIERLGAYDGSAIARDMRLRFGREAVAPRLLAVYRHALARGADDE